MSGEFFGRAVSGDLSFLDIDLCEVCNRKSPSWVEVKQEQNTMVIRVTCSDCHQEFIDTASVQREDLYTREMGSNEELTQSTRPGWVDDFIQEGQGTIEAINLEEGNLATSEIAPSEAPSTFQEVEPASVDDTEDPEAQEIQTAPWAAGFIQEALFGANPEQWLEDQGAYDESQIDVTLPNLANFSNHNVESVKLSAIQCLYGLYRRHQSTRDAVVEAIQTYQNMDEGMVKEFAEQTLGSIT